jgi:anti-anti-sigma factor
VDISQESVDAVPVIRITGDIDRLSAPVLEKAFRVRLGAGNHRIILDLGGCSYIDSGGLAAIMIAVGELRDDGLLAIVAPGLSVRRLLEVVGLYEHRRCAIFKTEQEALSALGLTPQKAVS